MPSHHFPTTSLLSLFSLVIFPLSKQTSYQVIPLTMGKKKNGGEKKKNGDGGEKKEEDNPLTVVLRIDMHCEGCTSKIMDFVNSFDGVDSFDPDFPANKLTVVGKFDPSKLQEMLEKKTKKKVDLISPQQSQKDDNKNDNKKKPDEKKPKEKEILPLNGKLQFRFLARGTLAVLFCLCLLVIVIVKYGDGGDKKEDNPLTVVLKIDMHCEGCASKIVQSVKSFDGVDGFEADCPANKLTVVGKVDPSKLREMLAEKTKKKVDLISLQSSKKDFNKNDNKKKPDEKKPKNI